jgi:hypothetical protein
MSGYRPEGLLAIGVALAVSACTDPTLNTDLRPEGPPEVTTAMVMTDDADTYGIPIELAVACKTGDEETPTYIGLPSQAVLKLCPEAEAADDDPVVEVHNADPLAWQVRVVFDELLNPDIETLTDEMGGSCDEFEQCTGHIAAANPFSIACTGATNVADVDYDGYYSPNGNNVSWPPGPSLVAAPTGFLVPTGSHCVATLNDAAVEDKDGNAADNSLGNFEFDISALAIAATDPEEDGLEFAVDFTPSITFNAPVSAASFAAGEITLVDANNVAVPFAVTADGQSLVITPTDPNGFAVGAYTLTILGTAEFTDTLGGPLTVGDDIVIAFTIA